jgi:hypothetical protein
MPVMDQRDVLRRREIGKFFKYLAKIVAIIETQQLGHFTYTGIAILKVELAKTDTLEIHILGNGHSCFMLEFT